MLDFHQELSISDVVKHHNLSFIASLNQKAALLASQGKDVLKLSGGDPSHLPETLCSIMEEMSKGNEKSIFSYSPIAGFDQLRTQLANIISPRYHRAFQKDNILVCSGGCSGLFLTFKTLLNPGDRVLIQDPCWEYLPRLIEHCYAKPVKMQFFSDPALAGNYDLLLTEIEHHLKTGIKLVSINSPLNPSGVIIPVPIKNKIIQLCHNYNVWFVSDDVTTDFNYIESEPKAIQAMDNFISVNSFSKNLGITGFRFGYVAAPEKIINELKKTQLYTAMYPNSLIQKIIEHYLSHHQQDYHDFIRKITNDYQARAKEYTALFSTIPSLHITAPEGGLFLFPRVQADRGINFERILEETHLAVAPGEAFSTHCKHHFRVFLGGNPNALSKATDILKEMDYVSS